MKYNKFIIKGYRGISDLTEINISKESLIPIIGKNESGKTTCLQAIYAFDHTNDKENAGKHLSNIENLYSTSETPIIIAAEIQIDLDFNLLDNFKTFFLTLEQEHAFKYPGEVFDILKIDIAEGNYSNGNYIKAYQVLTEEIKNFKPIIIERDLRLKQYKIPKLQDLIDPIFMNLLAESFVGALPYTLYFDDFRDRMAEKVYITSDETNVLYSSWILYLDELFKQTKEDYSAFSLASKQDSIRRSIVTEVEKFLNKILTEEWSKYQFENNDDIKIKIEYLQNGEIPFLQFKIVEKVNIENVWEDRYFDISDRSKGFFWYFNFMIKLHFNPNKRHINDVDTIYLLDEPGSYLHTYALNKLAEQLKNLSINNKVIYCTHFHNLLNPEFIPINSIRIAEKINRGKIILNKLNEANLTRAIKNSAFQPILDALEVKPPILEYDLNNIILLEGIYDYYSFKMFTSDFFVYFPCVSASSIVNQISYMIFLNKKYLALWDNDDEGRSRILKAKELFGEIEGKRFLLIHTINDQKNTRLEDYFNQSEIQNFNSKHLGLLNVAFYKTIINLFYDSNRSNLIKKYFPKTKLNFSKMEEALKLEMAVDLSAAT